MAVVNGTNLRFYVGDELIGCSTEASISFERDLPDSSCKDDDGWATHILGQKSWSISGSAYLDFEPAGTNVGFVDLFTDMFGTTSVTVKFSVATGATITAANEYTGTASITSLSLTAPNEDVSSFDIEATGTGEITQSVIV